MKNTEITQDITSKMLSTIKNKNIKKIVGFDCSVYNRKLSLLLKTDADGHYFLMKGESFWAESYIERSISKCKKSNLSHVINMINEDIFNFDLKSCVSIDFDIEDFVTDLINNSWDPQELPKVQMMFDDMARLYDDINDAMDDMNELQMSVFTSMYKGVFDFLNINTKSIIGNSKFVHAKQNKKFMLEYFKTCWNAIISQTEGDVLYCKELLSNSKYLRYVEKTKI